MFSELDRNLQSSHGSRVETRAAVRSFHGAREFGCANLLVSKCGFNSRVSVNQLLPIAKQTIM